MLLGKLGFLLNHPDDLLKILVLNYEYPPVGGGGGAVSAQVAEYLARKGHSLGVQTAAWADLPKRQRVDGVMVCRHFAFRRRKDRCSVLEMMLFVICGLVPTWRRIRRERPDLLHVHFAIPTGILAILLHWLTGVPYVITAHLGDVPGGVPAQTKHWFRLIHPLAKRIWQRAAATTAVSDFVADLARTKYQVAVETLPNGIELPPLSSLSRELHDPIRLVFAGRFHAQKNLGFLVRVLARISHLAWNFDFLGDGPERQEIERLIKEKGLGNRIHLHGWLPREQVDAILAKSDVLVMPSLSEGLPVVAVKALGFGLALAVSDIGGFRDVILPGTNGISLPCGDEEAFAKGMAGMLTDRHSLEAMKQQSRQLAAKFEIGQIIEGYEALFAAVGRQAQKE